MAAFFLCKKIFIQNVTFRHSHSPITASAKQAAQTQAESKRLHNAGDSESESACTTLRAERKTARQSVEQIRLTVSGLVTANV